MTPILTPIAIRNSGSGVKRPDAIGEANGLGDQKLVES